MREYIDSKIIDSVSLLCVIPNQNVSKFWNATLYYDNGIPNVKVHWGRIGTIGTFKIHVDAGRIQYNELVDAKLAKGYYVKNEGFPPARSPIVETKRTGRRENSPVIPIISKQKPVANVVAFEEGQVRRRFNFDV